MRQCMRIGSRGLVRVRTVCDTLRVLPSDDRCASNRRCLASSAFPVLDVAITTNSTSTSTSSSSSTNTNSTNNTSISSRRASNSMVSKGQGGLEVAEHLTVGQVIELLGKDMAATITIDEDASVASAARLMHTHLVGGLLVTSADSVAGIMTDRDILRVLGEFDEMITRPSEYFDESRDDDDSGRGKKLLLRRRFAEDSDGLVAFTNDFGDAVRRDPSASWQNRTLNDIKVREVMTPANRIVYVESDDTAKTALALLLDRGVRHVPVRHGSNILCLINIRDIIHAQQNLGLVQVDKYSGAKEEYLRDVLPRIGVENMSISMGLSLHDPIVLDASAACLPHPDKEATGGEDAHFVFSRTLPSQATSLPADDSTATDPTITVMGVADGVGSWSFEHGIDVGKFSRGLMRYCEQFATSYIDKQTAKLDIVHRQPVSLSPWRVLNRAWNELIRQPDLVGSCTVCLLTLDWRTWHLRASNIGDSGFLVLREPTYDTSALGSLDLNFRHGWEVVHRSRQQLHDFNAPYQVGQATDSRTDLFESPNDADNYALPVKPGDVVVLASDGLFDNMSEHEILGVVEKNIAGGTQHIADQLANTAKEFSLDRMRDGPFAIMAKDNGILWGGGRADDITVLVARVQHASALKEQLHESYDAQSTNNFEN